MNDLLRWDCWWSMSISFCILWVYNMYDANDNDQCLSQILRSMLTNGQLIVLSLNKHLLSFEIQYSR